MTSTDLNVKVARFLPIVGAAVFLSLMVLGAIPQTNAQTDNSAAPRSRPFATAQEAAEALGEAAEKYDLAALAEILGPDGNDIIHTGEPARDQEVAKKFAEQARAKLNVSVDAKTKRRAFLSVGSDDWPFPVPIVKVGNHWSFDSKA